ncbi:unnamed protein product [Rotaria socialis]|uniref:Uncharacterized protein n=2 Tax=Rotaria socialis TaxID=392032 RepID=A0A818XJF7_9BILA|nr:unnamed protein product [Rotaria socialis]
MSSIEELPPVQQKVLASLELWGNEEMKKENYSKLLNSIHELKESSQFDQIKHELDTLFEPEVSQVQVKKRKLLYDKIDGTLLQLTNEYDNGQLTQTDLAIMLGKAVKVNKTKK